MEFQALPIRKQLVMVAGSLIALAIRTTVIVATAIAIARLLGL